MEISTMPTDNVTDTQFNCTCPPQGRMISFNWDYAQTREDQDLSQFADNLAYARKLKFGHLYRCQGCDSWWFLGEEPGAMMCYVPPTSRQSLEDWNASNLIPDNRQIASLKEIGGDRKSVV